MATTDEHYTFLVEYFDKQANLVKYFDLKVFPHDMTLSMNLAGSPKIFLKRTVFREYPLEKYYPGEHLKIFGRLLHLKAFGDEYTKTLMNSQVFVQTYGVPASKYGQMGAALSALDGRILMKIGLTRLTPERWRALSPWASEEDQEPVLVFQCRGPWATPIDSPDVVPFKGFPDPVEPCLQLSHCACLLVKPHALSHLGVIVAELLDQGLEISGITLKHWTPEEAHSFFEVYQGVLPDNEYQEMVEECLKGPLVGLEVRHAGVVPKLKEVCGPRDPACGQGLRGRFGWSLAQNAVHCTDLEEDGVREVHSFFGISGK